MSDTPAQAPTSASSTLHVPARELHMLKYLSPAALPITQQRAQDVTYPDTHDREGWRTNIAGNDQQLAAYASMFIKEGSTHVEERKIDGVTVYVITPTTLPANDHSVLLDFHGGALAYGGGKVCQMLAQVLAQRLQRRIWTVDYRMPPDHPYPAGLDDAVAVYKALLKEQAAHDIIVHGTSAGGNIAAALLLRARDEGLPMPAAAVLFTPELDLTESGDSFQTNIGVDNVLRSLTPVSLLYAHGADLSHPYLSPLFGDFTKGFPHTFLSTGTRDLFLSNVVRMHRALRLAGVEAELHVVEAACHVGFPGAPEGEALDQEARIFIERILSKA